MAYDNEQARLQLLFRLDGTIKRKYIHIGAGQDFPIGTLTVLDLMIRIHKLLCYLCSVHNSRKFAASSKLDGF